MLMRLFFYGLILSLSSCVAINKSHALKNNAEPQIIAKKPITTGKVSHTSDNNIWHYIADRYSLSGYDNRQLNGHIRWFEKNPDYLTRVSKRAEPYIYWILKQVEAAGLPIEIALLPIVESAYYPFSYSPEGASGLWQFIPSTAKLYGLKENWWYDPRRDIKVSTKAAIAYLKNLNTLFKGDWLLAIASYNSGPGRVQRAIRKNQKLGKKTDFWHLSLPQETRGYVPRLLAVAELIKNPARYGQQITAIDNTPQVQSVWLSAQIDLALVAAWTKLTLADIYTLNPGLKRWATPSNRGYALLLPIDKIAQFKHNLSEHSQHSRMQWLRHKVRSGESLSYLADKFKTSVEQIMLANKLKTTLIKVGEYLIVPIAQKPADYYSLSDKQREKQRMNIKKNGIKIIHTVKKGESLWKIARKYNTAVANLRKWNRLSSKKPLQIGKKLLIFTLPKTKQNLPKTTHQAMKIDRKVIYTVKNGDNLSVIADKFNTSVEKIKKSNKLPDNKPLQPGQKLKIIISVVNTEGK